LFHSYYQLILEGAYEWANVNEGGSGEDARWQFNGTDSFEDNKHVGIMFNTDFYLMFDLTVDAEGKATCDPTFNRLTCVEDEQTAAIVEKYRDSNQAFINDFFPVFNKMLNTGYTTLNSLA